MAGTGGWSARPDSTAGQTLPGATADVDLRRDDDGDLVPPPSGVRAVLGALVASRRNMALTAAAVILPILLLSFLLGGDDDEPTSVASKGGATSAKATATVKAKAKAADEIDDPTPTEADSEKTDTPDREKDTVVAAADPVPTDDPTPEPPPAETPTETPPADTTAIAPTTATLPTTPKPPTGKPLAPKTGGAPKKTLGGKQLVLEYDAQAKEVAKPVPAAPKTDQAAIVKARTSYGLGNQRLMAGDWNGAILKYRQSLAHYPGYVAGYRGLGLAFAQMGDKPKALQSLRLYISSVPNAKDAPLIRKRIATLQSQSK